MDTTALSKDTVLCISLAGRPSNLGTRFHNHLYDQLGLDFVYKAFTTDDIAAAVGGIRALGIRGCGVSMPFKQAVLPLVDEVDPSAAAIGAVNTIVNTGGRLRAFNTDFTAVRALLAGGIDDVSAPAVVLGSGGMARAAAAALRDCGVRGATVVARNERTGGELAEQYGFDWSPTVAGLRPSIIINATPVGMAGGPQSGDLPVPGEVVDAAQFVMDAVAVPPLTPLIRRARAAGAATATGTEIAALQAAEQFALYTGVRPSQEELERASAFSREG